MHTEAQYRDALKVVSTLVDLDPQRGTSEADKLEVLGTLVQAYEAKHFLMDTSAESQNQNTP